MQQTQCRRKMVPGPLGGSFSLDLHCNSPWDWLSGTFKERSCLLLVFVVCTDTSSIVSSSKGSSMSPTTNNPSWEPLVQHSCHQHFCCPDVQHTDSRGEGRRAPAQHHQQHGERERWAQTQLSCGSTPGMQADQGQGLGASVS